MRAGKSTWRKDDAHRRVQDAITFVIDAARFLRVDAKTIYIVNMRYYRGGRLVEALVVSFDADLAGVLSRDENEIRGRQCETDRPPDRGVGQ